METEFCTHKQCFSWQWNVAIYLYHSAIFSLFLILLPRLLSLVVGFAFCCCSQLHGLWFVWMPFHRKLFPCSSINFVFYVSSEHSLYVGLRHCNESNDPSIFAYWTQWLRLWFRIGFDSWQRMSWSKCYLFIDLVAVVIARSFINETNKQNEIYDKWMRAEKNQQQ